MCVCVNGKEYEKPGEEYVCVHTRVLSQLLFHHRSSQAMSVVPWAVQPVLAVYLLYRLQ